MYLFTAGPDCLASPTTNVTFLILESTSSDIVGNQVNYSCSANCILQGSSSLRCRRVGGLMGFRYEWVNASGYVDSPKCLCQGRL